MRSKGFLYELGRWAAVLIGIVSLFVLFGGNSVSGADPREVADAVIDVIDMENMLEADNQMVKRFYGLDPSDYEGCILYYPNTNIAPSIESNMMINSRIIRCLFFQYKQHFGQKVHNSIKISTFFQKIRLIEQSSACSRPKGHLYLLKKIDCLY